MHANGTDTVLGDACSVADFGQQPPRFGTVLVAHGQFKPDRRAKFCTVAGSIGRRRRQISGQNLGGRAAFTPQADEGGGHIVRAVSANQVRRQIGLFTWGLRQGGVIQQAGVIARLHIFGRGRLDPFGNNLSALQQTLGFLEFGRGHDQRRDPLLTRTSGTARTVQQRFGRTGQIGMDHQFQPRKVNAACRHIGGNANPCPTIAQSLQRMGAFGLRQLARQGHSLKTTIGHTRKEMVHIGACFAKNDRGPRLVIAQQVKDRVFAVPHSHRDALIFNIGMLGLFRLHFNPQGVLLIGARQRLDLARDGGREHQRAPLCRASAQDKGQILFKAKVQHLVSFVQHHGADLFQLQRAAFDMVAQAARCAHHHMRAPVQHALFGAVIHATHTGGDLGIGAFVKPFKLARHLQRQFARRGDDQGKRHISIQKLIRSRQKFGRNSQAKGHSLARPRLGRDQKVAPYHVFGQHRILNGRQGFIAFRRQSQRQRRRNGDIGHVCSHRGGNLPVKYLCAAPLFPVVHRPPRRHAPWNPWADWGPLKQMRRFV